MRNMTEVALIELCLPSTVATIAEIEPFLDVIIERTVQFFVDHL